MFVSDKMGEVRVLNALRQRLVYIFERLWVRSYQMPAKALACGSNRSRILELEWTKKVGRFDRCTWDGSSGSRAFICMIELDFCICKKKFVLGVELRGPSGQSQCSGLGTST